MNDLYLRAVPVPEDVGDSPVYIRDDTGEEFIIQSQIPGEEWVNETNFYNVNKASIKWH